MIQSQEAQFSDGAVAAAMFVEGQYGRKRSFEAILVWKQSMTLTFVYDFFTEETMPRETKRVVIVEKGKEKERRQKRDPCETKYDSKEL